MYIAKQTLTLTLLDKKLGHRSENLHQSCGHLSISTFYSKSPIRPLLKVIEKDHSSQRQENSCACHTIQHFKWPLWVSSLQQPLAWQIVQPDMERLRMTHTWAFASCCCIASSSVLRLCNSFSWILTLEDFSSAWVSKAASASCCLHIDLVF